MVVRAAARIGLAVLVLSGAQPVVAQGPGGGGGALRDR